MSITHTLMVDGRERSYLLHVPPTRPAIAAWPVVLAFHGATSNGRLMEQFSGLSAKADEAGFLAVYPNGTGNLPNVLTWNGLMAPAGRGRRRRPAGAAPSEEVGLWATDST